MEGILETTEYRFHTNEASVIETACINLWNRKLKQGNKVSQTNTLNQSDLTSIFKYLQEHPELFFNSITYYNMLDKLASMIVLMKSKENCLVTLMHRG